MIDGQIVKIDSEFCFEFLKTKWIKILSFWDIANKFLSKVD